MKGLLRNKKIESVQEDPNYNEYIAELKPGWCYEEEGVHCFGFENVKQAKKDLTWIKKCNCPQCN